MYVVIQDGEIETHIMCESVLDALRIIETHPDVRAGAFRKVCIVKETLDD